MLQEETLLEAFRAYGNIQHIKLLRDKGGVLVARRKPACRAVGNCRRADVFCAECCVSVA